MWKAERFMLRMLRAARGAGFVTVLVAVAALVAFNGVAWTLFHDAFPSVSLLPGEARHAPVKGSPVGAGVAVTQVLPPTPAETVLATVLAGTPPGVAAPGWTGTPVDTAPTNLLGRFSCGVATPQPVLSRSRTWTATSGPLPDEITANVSVTVAAYGAGQGAPAAASLRDTARACRAASAHTRHGWGVEAFEVRGDGVTGAVWRRGDVTVTVTVAGDPAPGLGQVADFYDARLASALNGVCANQESTGVDASRSPHADRATYTGLAVPRTITLPEPAITPHPVTATPPPAPAPVSTAPPVPVPAPTLDLPDVGDLPTRPALPVPAPTALPSPVPSPTIPLAPTPAPTSTTVLEQVRDDIGPGCGWAFTRQAAPVMDTEQARLAYQSAVAAARHELTVAWQAWEDARATYYEAYAQYVTAAAEYRTYVTDVNHARTVWANVEAERDVYRAAKNTYDAAVAARDAFLTAQAEASASYVTAGQACQNQPVTPPPTPTITSTTPTSTAPTSTTPTSTPPTVTATPDRAGTTPTAPSTPSPSPDSGGCPQERPAILDEQPPSVPPLPSAPAHMPVGEQ